MNITNREIADLYGLNEAHVSRIKNGGLGEQKRLQYEAMYFYAKKLKEEEELKQQDLFVLGYPALIVDFKNKEFVIRSKEFKNLLGRNIIIIKKEDNEEFRNDVFFFENNAKNKKFMKNKYICHEILIKSINMEDDITYTFKGKIMNK